MVPAAMVSATLNVAVPSIPRLFAMEKEGATFTVAGIYHGSTALVAGTVIMPLDQLQQLSSKQGKVTAFHLRLRPLPARRSRRASLTGRGAAA
jgi:ABC-type lipoprotein release transport system permease subunit